MQISCSMTPIIRLQLCWCHSFMAASAWRASTLGRRGLNWNRTCHSRAAQLQRPSVIGSGAMLDIEIIGLPMAPPTRGKSQHPSSRPPCTSLRNSMDRAGLSRRVVELPQSPCMHRADLVCKPLLMAGCSRQVFFHQARPWSLEMFEQEQQPASTQEYLSQSSQVTPAPAPASGGAAGARWLGKTAAARRAQNKQRDKTVGNSGTEQGAQAWAQEGEIRVTEPLWIATTGGGAQGFLFPPPPSHTHSFKTAWPAPRATRNTARTATALTVTPRGLSASRRRLPATRLLAAGSWLGLGFRV